MVVKGQAGYPSIPAVLKIMKIYKGNLEENLQEFDKKEARRYTDVMAGIRENKEKLDVILAEISEIKMRVAAK